MAAFRCAIHVSRIRDSGSIGLSWAGGVRVLFGLGDLRAYIGGLRLYTGKIRPDFMFG